MSGLEPGYWSVCALTDPKGPKAALLSSIAAQIDRFGGNARLVVHPLSARGALRLAREILRESSVPGRNAWFRFNWAIGPLIALIALRIRSRGGTTVLSVPTPVVVARKEFAGSKSKMQAVVKRIFAQPLFSVAAMTVDLIVEHGVPVDRGIRPHRKAAVVMPNPGPEVAKTAKAPCAYGPRREVKFVGVSSNGHYHRYERFLRGLVNYQRSAPGYPQVVVDIIGPLEAFSRERQLVNKFPALGEAVRFHGLLSHEQLSEVIQAADIALGPLGAGACRGLELGSALRHRHYMSLGLPFVSDLPDLALGDGSVDWARFVESSNAPIDVTDLIAWLHELDAHEFLPEMHRVVQESNVEHYVRNVIGALTRH